MSERPFELKFGDGTNKFGERPIPTRGGDNSDLVNRQGNNQGDQNETNAAKQAEKMRERVLQDNQNKN